MASVLEGRRDHCDQGQIEDLKGWKGRILVVVMVMMQLIVGLNAAWVCGALLWFGCLLPNSCQNVIAPVTV